MDTGIEDLHTTQLSLHAEDDLQFCSLFDVVGPTSPWFFATSDGRTRQAMRGLL